MPVLPLESFLPADAGLSLVAAREEAQGFLQELHRACMREAVEATWGRWDEAWQAQRWAQHLRLGRIQLMVRQRQPIGMLEYSAEADLVWLHNLQILPPWQGQGMGQAVVQALQAWAMTQGRGLRLQVLVGNPRARRFYERQGLTVTGADGQRITMDWPASDG